jgi:hypothetical protein
LRANIFNNMRLVRYFLIFALLLESLTALSCTSSNITSPPNVQNSPNPIPLLSDARISVSVDKSNVQAGEAFTVNILIDTQKECRGAQWKLVFDPKTMRCEKVNEGNFFKDWAKANGGDTIVLPQPTIDNNAGRVSDMGIAVMTQKIGGSSGKGVLGIYNFTALNATISTPTLSDILVADSTSKTFRVATNNPE